MPPRENEALDKEAEKKTELDEFSEDDAETVELSRLRCTSIRTEEIADREKQKASRRQRCADYPGLAFGSAAFGSETMMKFNIIKNELHNIMRSQLKRVDGEVTALSQRIKALDENLAKSEQYIKTATAALADAVAMEVERRKNSKEDEISDEESDNPLSQFDAQMAILEGKFLEAKYLANKSNSSQNLEEKPAPTIKPEMAQQQNSQQPPPKLRRPFPVP